MGEHTTDNNTSNIYCVRADFGEYTEHFVKGGYVAIDYGLSDDLSNITSFEETKKIFCETFPNQKSNSVIGIQAGQIYRFLSEIKQGDYVITPCKDTELLCYGRIKSDPSYFFSAGDDGCPFRHRRRVEWETQPIRRAEFSVPFQNTMRASLTVFAISHRDEFLRTIGVLSKLPDENYDSYTAVLDQILKLDPTEFEILITHLLAALGFEGAEHTGKVHDGGVDATGELNIGDLAKVSIFVQVKRYQIGSKINANVVKDLRKSIPVNGQGAFITTADFQNKAFEVATEPGFPRIGLIKGHQLVDLLVEYWNDLPKEFQDKLGLRPGLVKV